MMIYFPCWMDIGRKSKDTFEQKKEKGKNSRHWNSTKKNTLSSTLVSIPTQMGLVPSVRPEPSGKLTYLDILKKIFSTQSKDSSVCLAREAVLKCGRLLSPKSCTSLVWALQTPMHFEWGCIWMAACCLDGVTAMGGRAPLLELTITISTWLRGWHIRLTILLASG